MAAIFAALAAGILVDTASAQTASFYNDQAAWQAAAGLTTHFDTTAANVALADEVDALPGKRERLCWQEPFCRLTWRAAQTGLCHDFELLSLQPDADLIFDDDEFVTNFPQFDDAISIGDIDDHEDDDFQIRPLPEGVPVSAIGFDLHNNSYEPGETLSVYGPGDTLLGTFSLEGTGASIGFLGVVADVPIRRVVLDEDAGFNDVAVGGFHFLDLNAVDSDGDGASYCAELAAGTDPDDPDTDGDALLDGFELDHGFDPLVGGQQSQDPDADGLDNLGEQGAGTDPNAPDSDGDGLLDGFEVSHGFDPQTPGDESGDPDADGLDNLGEQTEGTDPHDPDSDGDGLLDGWEIQFGFDPTTPGEHLEDPDGDGMRNLAEQQRGTDPYAADTDGDGLDDGAEVGRARSEPFQDERIIDTDVCSRWLTPVDLDSDGDVDLIARRCRNETGFRWYRNQDSHGEFGPAILVDSSGLFIAELKVADVDQDGRPDVVAAVKNKERNPTSCQFGWFQNLDGTGGPDFQPLQVLADLSCSPFNGSFSVDDLDGDGDPDLVSSQPSGFVYWWENQMGEIPGGFASPQLLLEELAELSVDLDSDGDLDFLGPALWDPLGPNGSPRWFENRLDEPSADVVEGVTLPFTFTAGPARWRAIGDLDLDGDPDMVQDYGIDGLGYGCFENRLGEPTADFARCFIPTTALTGGPLALADVDGDGDLDLLAAYFEYGNQTIWVENRWIEGEGFPTEHLVTTRLNHKNTGIIPVDLDGDGDDDLLVTYRGRSILWFANPGTDPTSVDSDGDGLEDGDEVLIHATDPAKRDSDQDGIDDGDEVASGTDPTDPDSDADGLSDGAEVNEHGTDPLVADSDGDGLLDGFEVRHGFDPLAAGDEAGDPDGDGLDNLGEQANGSHPHRDDSDGDGLTDGEEVATHGTAPDQSDTDLDGLRDGFEVAYGFDPLLAGDTHADPDGDGLDNLAEDRAGTDPHVSDTDADGLDDGAEVGRVRTLPLALAGIVGALDGDGDVTPLAADLDGDGDPDVLASTSDGTRWFENRLDEPTADFAPGRTIFMVGWEQIALADLNGDDAPDLIVSDYPNPLWYPNRIQEPGSDFGAPLELPVQIFGINADVHDFEIVDLDDDGDLDVAWGTWSSDFGWTENRLNEAAASMGPAHLVHPNVTGQPGLFSFDSDADGLPDLAVSGVIGSAVFINELDAAIPSFQTAPGIPGGYSSDQWITDLDGDLDLDVISLSSSRLDRMENRLDEATADWAIFPGFASVHSEAYAHSERYVGLSDLDRDGAPDLIVASWSTFSWWRNELSEPAGVMVRTQDPGPAETILLVDLDGDGDDDVVVWPGGLELVWYRNPGLDPTSADTDGDGLIDGDEVNLYGSDPSLIDTDADGIRDGDEVLVHGTSPVDADTDGDGISDGDELNAGTDPLDPLNLYSPQVPALGPLGLGLLAGLMGLGGAIAARRRA